MDLPALSDFNLVDSHGGFGRAARASGRPKATLSRRVSELEASLATRLIERGGHSLRLTEAGALLHARTGLLLGEIAAIGASVGRGLDKPRGRLRVSAPLLFSNTQLCRVATTFITAYPEVDLEIRSEDGFVYPVDEDFDVVIRVNPRPDERLVGRCVLRNEQWLKALPDIARPEPTDSTGVAALRYVVRSPPRPDETWQVHDGRAGKTYWPISVLRLSSLPTVRDAVVVRARAALVPHSLVGGDVAAGRMECWGWLEGLPTKSMGALRVKAVGEPKGLGVRHPSSGCARCPRWNWSFLKRNFSAAGWLLPGGSQSSPHTHSGSDAAPAAGQSSPV